VAVAPLFVADMTALKTLLRLEGAKAPGALASIDQAVREARIRFYEELAPSRITALVAYSVTDTPSTESEILRSLAASVEIRLVRLDLKKNLPSIFLDGSAVKQQVWNDEAAFVMRQMDAREIEKLENQIVTDFEKLRGDQELDDESSVQVSTIGPEEGTVDRPGASLFPGLRAPFVETEEGE